MESAKNNYFLISELLKYKNEDALSNFILDLDNEKKYPSSFLTEKNNQAMGRGYHLETSFFERHPFVDTVKSIAIAFLIVIGASVFLRWSEERFLSQEGIWEITIVEEVSVASFENAPSVRQIINEGYLNYELGGWNLESGIKNLEDSEINKGLTRGEWLRKVLGIRTAQAAGVKSFQAKKKSQNYKEFNIKPGQAMTIEVVLENTGREIWRKKGDNNVVLRVYGSNNGQSDFYHEWWSSQDDIVGLIEDEVRPGEEANFRFPIKAPETEGEYLEKYKVMMGDAFWLEGSLIEIKISVLKDFSQKYIKEIEKTAVLSSEYESLEQSSGESTNLAINNFSANPELRVGLYSTIKEIQIRANSSYEARDINNKLIFEADSSEITTVEFNFETKKYLTKFKDYTNISSEAVKFKGKNKNTILEIVNFENRPAWNPKINDNKFRGDLEVYYSAETGKFWVINELSLEDYLKGLAESSNSAPYEFQKALVIAARTYALYHYENPTKHDEDNFIVDATYDQVYRGYNLESRLTNFVRAVEETKGEVVTYNGEVVVTPYFSQSDGRTRDWAEVWGGEPKPWLRSKDDPFNHGKELWGHGVGMSASGAMGLADNGSSYENILKYYYTGVEIKIYIPLSDRIKKSE